MRKRRCLSLLVLVTLLITVMPAGAEALPVVLTQSLPEGMSGVYYGTRLQAQGERPMVWGYGASGGISNAFPEGMSLSESGVLSGTPSYPGDYHIAVTVTNPAGTTTQVYQLHIAPFDEARLPQGGENIDIIGEGNDSIVGLANGMNGGRLTMQGDEAFFIDGKGYLMGISAPFNKKAKRLFGAVRYANIDSDADFLYYFHRYLDNEASKAQDKNVYVTYVAADPIAGRGRYSLLDLRLPDFKDLKITDRVLTYIGYDGVMGRILLKSKASVDLRSYHDGQELRAEHAFPYNGRIWFQQVKTGQLYSMPLDGQVARQLTDSKTLRFTIARMRGEDRLLYTDKNQKLYSADLQGGDIQPLGKLYASQLNANADYVFFADAKGGNRLKMFPVDDPGDVTKLSDVAVDQIYAFPDFVAYQKKGSKQLYILSLGSEDKAVRISQ